MDSMRSLNTSLPSTRPAPPEQLLQAFRTAALSVTNLYKSAVTDQNASRQAGYQDALEDLLSFLDKENLGLQDGEGWRVRQWATERYEGSTHHHQIESDDERSETGQGQTQRGLTPAGEQTVATTAAAQSAPARAESSTQTDDHQSSSSQEQSASAPMFYFSGNPASTSLDDMQTEEDGTAPTETQASSSTSGNVSRTTLINNRGNRTPHRTGNQRHGTRSSTREFTFTAGTKRKFQIPDFFDISNIGPRDGFESSKRGRTS
ncbi:uncharacterized protein Z520_08829 [Fonsecaea multimorphosa CBS 102226]|uniref:Uncharacterized protein n=1 Tax=Fonsecaea multimorphosa CBS 102226 TaxID=1442371 RepID=A0A0D2JPM3_9EURO|nr:uncharacterized protein Z520_08829 [Fonsecaea multimorphosa CBS 102226]KIX95312.1 hypothetical protein Z520_08829 [Fonsecaea multimorphosa CBS 102226]OAL21111.1 hypothetical protein AYO22_08268 [Fonsecaea multimorphosa]